MNWLEVMKEDVRWLFRELNAGANHRYMIFYVARKLKD